MARRITDTTKWDDDWFLGLPVRMKSVWEYLRDTCDGGGLKKLSLRKMSTDIGVEITRDDMALLGDRIHWVSEDVVWIPGYIKFQQKTLSPKNKAHVNIARMVLRAIDRQPLSPKAEAAACLLRDLLLSEQVPPEAIPAPVPALGPAAEPAVIGKRIKDKEEDPLSLKEKSDTPRQPNWFESFCFEVFSSTGLSHYSRRVHEAFHGSREEFFDWFTDAFTNKHGQEKDILKRRAYFETCLKNVLRDRLGPRAVGA